MSEDVEVEESGPDRRSIMKAAALVVVPVAGVGAVAACSSSNSSTDSSSTGGSGSGSGGTSANGGGSGSGSGNGTLTVPSASVPVGGGFIDQANLVVVTQPTAGQFKAFTAVCTHQGCTVGSVSNNQIICPCHGSTFSAKDGSVINGPAATPLAAMTATVSGGNVDITSSSK